MGRQSKLCICGETTQFSLAQLSSVECQNTRRTPATDSRDWNAMGGRRSKARPTAVVVVVVVVAIVGH